MRDAGWGWGGVGRECRVGCFRCRVRASRAASSSSTSLSPGPARGRGMHFPTDVLVVAISAVSQPLIDHPCSLAITPK